MAIYNLRRLQAKTKVQTDGYADDMDKNASSEEKCKVSQSCDNYDLTINIKRQRFTPTSTRKTVQ